MCRSSVVGLLALVLCFVAYVSVSAVGEVTATEPPKVSKDTAAQAVKDAQNTVNEVSEKATTNLSNTKSILVKVEAANRKTSEAESQAIQAATNNQKANAIVENIRTTSQGVTKLHESVKEKLMSTISSLEKVVEEVKQLKDQLTAVIPAVDAASENYSGEQAKALEIKGKAVELDATITEALTAIDGVSSTANEMEKKANDAELANLHVSVIVAVAEIDTIIEDTGNSVEETQNKKNEVNEISQAMKDLKAKQPSTLTEKINELFKSSDEELSKATDLLTKAEQYQTAVTEQKQKADAALTAVASAKVINTAQQDVENVKECVTQVKELVPQLKSALQTASISLTNAKESKQNLVTALSSTTTAQRTEEVKETENSDPSVEGGAGAGQNNATTQPPSKDSVGQSTDSADKLKDALSNSAQNVSTTALTGGKAPAPGANNDSAMTVSVPLLVALIASSVLQ